MHRAIRLSINSDELAKPLSDEKQEGLSAELKHLHILIIDERSMLNSQLLRATERNLRQFCFG